MNESNQNRRNAGIASLIALGIIIIIPIIIFNSYGPKPTPKSISLVGYDFDTQYATIRAKENIRNIEMYFTFSDKDHKELGTVRKAIDELEKKKDRIIAITSTDLKNINIKKIHYVSINVTDGEVKIWDYITSD
jgi:hypothetical protein